MTSYRCIALEFFSAASDLGGKQMVIVIVIVM